jgi:hypothetical protein
MLVVNVIPGLLQVTDDPLGELVPGIVRRVFLQEAAQQPAAASESQADREHEAARRTTRDACGRPLLRSMNRRHPALVKLQLAVCRWM